MAHGKKARAANREHRLEVKRAKKAANQVKYLRWKEEGKNQKSKRFTGSAKKRQSVRVVSHPTGPCGNIGCLRCNPENYHPFLKNGKPQGMSSAMYNRWVASKVK